jgi:hypothetical protein
MATQTFTYDACHCWYSAPTHWPEHCYTMTPTATSLPKHNNHRRTREYDRPIARWAQRPGARHAFE